MPISVKRFVHMMFRDPRHVEAVTQRLSALQQELKGKAGQHLLHVHVTQEDAGLNLCPGITPPTQSPRGSTIPRTTFALCELKSDRLVLRPEDRTWGFSAVARTRTQLRLNAIVERDIGHLLFERDAWKHIFNLRFVSEPIPYEPHDEHRFLIGDRAIERWVEPPNSRSTVAVERRHSILFGLKAMLNAQNVTKRRATSKTA